MLQNISTSTGLDITCQNSILDLTTSTAKFVRWLHLHTMIPVSVSFIIVVHPTSVQLPLPSVTGGQYIMSIVLLRLPYGLRL